MCIRDRYLGKLLNTHRKGTKINEEWGNTWWVKEEANGSTKWRNVEDSIKAIKKAISADHNKIPTTYVKNLGEWEN